MTWLNHLAEPLWLLVGLIAVPVALLLHGRLDQLQRRRIRAFSVARNTDSARFAVSRPLLWFRRAIWSLAVLAICVALARPLGSMQMQETEQRGLDILFAIDTSRSMLTPDVKPDRLTRAKLAVEDVLERLNADGVGLVAFAGEAFLQAPVTTDYEAFRETLEALDTNTIALGGTDIASAIRLSESTLASRGDTQKVMVLITDGEDLAGDALLAAQAAAKQGMLIFTVGVGTEAGELIPIPDGAGGTRFVKDLSGNFVRSRLDADMLKQIAAVTGGVYTPLGAQGQGVVNLYETKLKDLAQRRHSDRQVAVYAELFQWPLGAGIGLLILEWLLGVAVRRRTTAAVPSQVPLIAALVLGVFMTATPRVRADPLPLTAQQEYAKGQYTQAQRDYARSIKIDPAQTHLEYNLGTAAYKAGDFQTAINAFNNALKTQDVPLQQSAYYNLGNALFRQGEKGVKTDPQTTINTWKQSLGAYDTALQMRPRDADAKFNRDVVQRRLDELQRQQKQKQNKQQNQNNKDDKDNKDKQQDKQNQQKQPGQQGQQDPQGQPGQQNQQNQQGQPDPQNPQKQQGQPKPDPQGQQGQPKPDPQGQQGQPKPDPQGQQGQPKPDPQGQQGQQPPQQAAAAAAQDHGKPGQMSRVEAEQLLDSAKGDERHLGTGMLNAKHVNPLSAPLRDW